MERLLAFTRHTERARDALRANTSDSAPLPCELGERDVLAATMTQDCSNASSPWTTAMIAVQALPLYA